jgi:glycerophosphoryl diester phosphodiesterase
MFECDVKLSADGVPFLLHDATLERTTNGTGIAGQQPWHVLSQLDAGAWHSTAFAGERLPTLADVAQLCHAQGWMLNIEIKPTPGLGAETGAAVAQAALALWAHAPIAPLLTSFDPTSLTAAQAVAPNLPRGLLVDENWEGAVDTARELACTALVCHRALWNATAVQQARGAGLKTLAYTVNDAPTANKLWTWGIDGLITDQVHEFNPG